MLRDLYNSSRSINEKIVNRVNNALIDLSNAVNRTEISENGNPDKIVDIVEEILKFNKQQKENRLPLNLAISLKILSPMEILKDYL